MFVRKRVETLVDIGPLDGALRLPMSGRKQRGMTSTCRYCGHWIEDEFFITGFKEGKDNMMFHEGCVDEHTLSLIE